MKIVMLVNNDCSTDSRVIREAEALADSGHDVHVLAHRSADLPDEDLRNKVFYKRLPVAFSSFMGASKAAAKRQGVAGNQSKTAARSTKAGVRGLARSMLPSTAVAYAKTCGEGTLVHHAQTGTLKVLDGFAAATVNVRRAPRIAARITAKTVVTPFGAELLRHAHGYSAAGIALRPDVVHAHDLYTLLAGRRIAKATGAKLVYDSHELETGRNGNYSSWEKKLRARVERSLIRRADAVVTVCDSIADHLSALYCIPRPAVVLNAPGSDEFVDASASAVGAASSSGDLRTFLSLSDRDDLAVYVGSVTINRGLEQCVQALAHYPTLHFATVGPRRPQTEAELVGLAEQLGVRDRLHLVDPVPHNEVTSFVRTAGVSLIPIQNVCLSYQYCFPNKLLESLLSGVPVVVSDLVELRRMIEKTGCGVTVDETDPKAIADGIRAVLQDRDRFAPDDEMIKWLRDTYSWDRQREVLSDLYRGLGAKPAS